MADFHAMGQHNGDRAVFFRCHANGTLHLFNIQSLALDNVVRVYLCEHFRDIRSTLGEEHSNTKISARDGATTNVVTVTPSDNIQHALELISSKDISQLPVVSEKDSRELLGALRKKEVFAAYDKAVLRREIEAK